jgi:hypothetical protein
MAGLKCPLCKQSITSSQYEHVKKDIENLFQQRYSQKLQSITERENALKSREKSLRQDLENQLRSKYDLQVKRELQKLKKGWTNLQKEKDRIKDQKRKLSERVEHDVNKKTLKYRDQILKSQRREAGYLRKLQEMERRLEKATTDELGGISEDKLHEMLITQFGKYGDEIEKIEKRYGGADFVQRIMYKNRECGKIIYENKNTVNWDNNWIKKIKQDMTAQNAQYGIIVTNVFPRNTKYLTNIDGITVAHASVVLYIAALIRDGVIDVEKQSLSEVEKDSKMNELYQYITGNEFTVSIRAIFEAIKSLDDIRQAEQRTHSNVWTKQQNETSNINLNLSRIASKLRLIVEKEPISVLTTKKKKELTSR